jgi:hypothetical protein
MSELSHDDSSEFSGAKGLARLVMYSAEEPWLTRSKARYELMLHASRDAELAATLQQSVKSFYALARDVVAQWHRSEQTPDSELIENQAIATLTFINGVMMSFVAGRPVVDNVEHLTNLIQAVITGVSQTHRH